MIQSSTRRQAIGAAILGLGALVAVPALAKKAKPMEKIPAAADHAALTALRQEVMFTAPPARVYAALLSTKDFAAFTGMPAEIEPTAGGAFSTFGGMIIGRNVELVPGQRIVQAWKPADWPAGLYSLVHFELAAEGAGTKLVLDHTGFPPGGYDHLTSGWHERYWEPLAKFLA